MGTARRHPRNSQGRDTLRLGMPKYLDGEDLADLIENAAMAIELISPDGTILWANRAELQLLGYRSEEYIGRHLSEFHADEAVLGELLDRLARGEEFEACEAKLRTKDGSIRHVCLTANARWKNGRLVHTRCFTRDLTEQMRAAELRQHLAAIVESSDDAIISKDMNGIIRSWNKGAERIFGYTAEEILGEPIATLAVPDRADEMPNILDRIRRGERVDHYETKRRTKDGRVLSISLTVSPIRDASGTVIGASKVARNITEQKTAEETRRALERELMLLIEASGTLFASPRTEDAVRRILETAKQSIVADAYAVWRKESTGQVWKLIVSSGLSEEYHAAALRDGATGQGLPPQPVAIEDVEQFPLVQHRADLYRAEGIRSMLTIPLSVHGEVGGSLVFYYRSPRRFAEAEVRIGAALGNLAAAALSTAELYERQLQLRNQAERAERQASFLAEAGAVLSSSLEFEATLKRVAETAVPRLADWCSVDLLDEDGEMRNVAVVHQDPAKVQLAFEFRRKHPPRETQVLLTAVRTGRPVFIEELREEELLLQNPERAQEVRALGIKSVIVVPMVARGRALGTLLFAMGESGHRYSAGDVPFVEELARRAATAIDNAKLYTELRESESHFRQLAGVLPAFVWVSDSDGRVSYLNERWYGYTGRTPDQSLGVGWADIVHPDDMGRVQAVWDDARAREVLYSEECRLRSAGGMYRWFLSRAVPVRGGAGRTLRWFGTATDIHDAKEARETAELLNRVGPALAAELDPEKLAQDVTDLATRLTNAQFGALLQNVVNNQGESYTLTSVSGIERETFAGFPLPHDMGGFAVGSTGQGIVRSDDVTQDPRYRSTALASDTPNGRLSIRSYLAVPVVSRSGEALAGLFFGHTEPGRFTEWHERVVAGVAGQAAIALDNARLFGALRVAREAAERSNEELRRANADLEQFAYSASHDLKEPLRMMSIYSQMLRRNYPGTLDIQTGEYFGYLIEGGRRMEELVEGLLAYTRVLPTSADMPVRPVEADSVLDKVLVNLSRAIQDSGATVVRNELPALLMADVHLTQLFQNMLENAIKYRGEEPPRILIEAAAAGGFWQISMRDNGIGIAPEYASQVFGIFKRLHTAEQYSGAGIGLAICQRIVQRYGGRIWVESEGEGKGSTFCFTLPAAQRQA